MSKLKFDQYEEYLVCKFEADITTFYKERLPENWEKYEHTRLKSVFHLHKNDIVNYNIYFDDSHDSPNDFSDYYDDEEELVFIVGNISTEEPDYFVLSKKVMGINNDIFIEKNLISKLNHKYFIAQKQVSIFSKIDFIIDEPLYITSDQSFEKYYHELEVTNNADELNYPKGMPFSEFKSLIKKFPTSTTVKLYVNNVISKQIEDYVNLRKDFTYRYEEHYRKHRSVSNIKIGERNLGNIKYTNGSKSEILDMIKIKDNEIEKYTFLYEQLSLMLKKNTRNPQAYTESDWQKILINIILLLFPKYIYVSDEVIINSGKRIDYILVTAEGHVDIIEIKKPTIELIPKTKYRNVYRPSSQLSSTVMQVENYIYDITKNIEKNEKMIQKHFSEKLESFNKSGIDIEIINPKGFIISGRSNFSEAGKYKSNEITEVEKGFRLIKSKYRNIIDVYSYDDILKMLFNILNSFHDS